VTDSRHGGRGGFGPDDMKREYDDAPTIRSDVSEPAGVSGLLRVLRLIVGHRQPRVPGIVKFGRDRKKW
jgi:hypothetical protein